MKTLFFMFACVLSLSAQDAFQVKVVGHGTPMILIPGLSSSGEVWDSTVDHYKDRYECHVLTVAGFTGVPRVPAPMLDHVRDGVAAYIRAKNLAKPVIVGHSLGGFLALAIASKYPELPGKIVIVDAYPFFAALAGDENITLEKAKENAAQMRKYMDQGQDMYERYVKSGTGTRAMVTKDADLDRLIAWGLASDRTVVTDAMAELFSNDLRADLAKVQAPALVMATWIGYKDYTDHSRTEANLRRQYSKLPNVQLRITDTARHFIMWDDPAWMFAQMDPFLTDAK